MAVPHPKFPRRHAQRQALCIRNEASHGGLRKHERHQRQYLHITRNQRVGFDRDSDIDEEDKRDSGYASNSDIESEYLNGLVEKFREAGPQISNLGKVALEMIQIEQGIWQKYASSLNQANES